jgi:hypothetical protein
MIILGLILVLVAAGAIVTALVAAPAQTATFDMGAFSLEMNTVGVFFAGAGAVVLLAVGLELIRSGARRANRRRKDKRELNRLSQQLEARDGARVADSQATDTRTADRTATTSSSGTASASPPPTTTEGRVPRDEDTTG